MQHTTLRCTACHCTYVGDVVVATFLLTDETSASIESAVRVETRLEAKVLDVTLPQAYDEEAEKYKTANGEI